MIAGATLVVTRNDNITTYECAIPWQALGIDAGAEDFRGFSFGVFVNDADGASRKGYLEWASIKSLAKMQPVKLNFP